MPRTGPIFSKPIEFNTPGEAEAWHFSTSGYLADAIAAAEGIGVRFDWAGDWPDYENEETEWFMRALEIDAAVAIEQCCDDARVLPRQLRETRLLHFSPVQRIAAEKFLDAIPDDVSTGVLRFIYWTVRIERAKRTGSPEFDPSRPLRARELEE